MYKLFSAIGVALVATANWVVMTDDLQQPIVAAALGFSLVLSIFNVLE